VTARRCPRCGGNLFPDDGAWTCLQCGRTARLVPVTVLPRPKRERERWDPGRKYPTPERFMASYALTMDYIRDHPGCITREVAEAIGMPGKSMGTRLSTLLRAGQLVREGSGGTAEPFRWYVAEVQEASA